MEVLRILASLYTQLLPEEVGLTEWWWCDEGSP